MQELIICRGENVRYQACARLRSQRRYTLIGKPTRSPHTALRRLADAMAAFNYERGQVLLLSDYYDPTPIYEVVRL